MMKDALFSLLLGMTVIVASFSPAGAVQRTPRPPGAVYRLNFTLDIVENNERDTRKYTLVLEEREEGKMRALTKVPISVEEGRVRYVETGVKCDARYREQDGQIFLEVEVHFTSLLPPSEGAQISQPMIQEWQSQVEATISPGVAAVVTSFDDPKAGRHYELTVNAQKLR